ncbi:hypothetical protein AKJ55_01070 [candidate division MSBL1 archaeon SCGC-AAA382M17]|uniref:Chromosome partition protein Smc n=1 Tax=candidate division MSBL1 archaeon SCGC-AAA382M17 TaxID=1698284 RepID=A0ABR5TJJ2_9EURY|nr:hypothetical protein AKJ55_01070 [candidate division MSBL1 archaeon SCGC-AAA382M17]
MVFEKLKELFSGGEEKEEIEEVEEISIKEVEDRVENEKNRIIREAEEEVQPLLEKISNIQTKIDNTSDSLRGAESAEEVHPNLYKSAQEARRLLLKKIDRATGRIRVPSEPEWNELLDFNRSLQDANNLLKNGILSHGSRVAALFESKVNKLRRLMDSMQSLSRELNKSLRKANLKLEEFDDLVEDISEKDRLLNQKSGLKKKVEKLQGSKTEIEKSLERKEKSLESLKRSQRFKDLKDTKKEIKNLSRQEKLTKKKIDSAISELARPLRKLDKMIERDEHMVSSKVLEALDSYLDDPVQAALSEEESLPKLKAMLHELEEVLEDKMRLSDRERRKRIDEVRGLREDKKVERLREKYIRIRDRRQELEKERQSSSLLEKKDRLEGSVEDKKSELRNVENKLSKIKKNLSEVEEKVQDKKTEIRKNVRDLLDAKVKEP